MQAYLEHVSGAFSLHTSLLFGTLLCKLHILPTVSTSSTQQDFEDGLGLPTPGPTATKPETEVMTWLVLFVSFLSEITVMFY